MKKSIVILMIVVLGLSVSLYAHNQVQRNEIQTTMEEHMTGKHCSGTVGCDCPGFSPITSGEEWQKAYCRRCGHKRSYHK